MQSSSTPADTMNDSGGILNRAEQYVFSLLRTLQPGFVYHDYTHTVLVVEACRRIAEGEGLSEIEKEITELAAWFHDSGYTRGYVGHEDHGVDIATEFLAKEGYPQERIQQINGCILATKVPQSPKTILERVVCDADLSHVGKKIFHDRSSLLRTELGQITGRQFTDFEWAKSNIDFLANHKFHTDFARGKWDKRKTEHLFAMQQKLQLLLETKNTPRPKKEAETQKPAKKEDKEKRSERGIETMFRVSLRNHMDLSSIADQKANILISINALVISVILTLAARELERFAALALPTMVLLAVNTLTILFATLATRPKITEGKFTHEDVRAKRANLLFFGNFYNMSHDDFQSGMRAMLDDGEYLYRSMIFDFYSLGKVLGRKYRFLRVSYDIFMYGIILTVILYTISFALAMQPSP